MPEPEALAVELAYGIQSLAVDRVRGAGRFAAGAGRHGAPAG